MDLFNLKGKISLDGTGFMSAIDSAMGAVKGLVTAIGAATGAVVAFAGTSVSVGMEFDKSMSQVAATMGTTVSEIEDLRSFAMQMGSTTAFSATQAADALNYMALAGYSAETSMDMLPNVLNLAAAGGIDLAYASDMVTDSQSALGLSLEDTSAMIDQMARASSKTNTSVAQLGDAILTVGGTAKNLAGGTKELSAVLGVLADNGIKGSEAGTHLRNIMLAMNPTTEAAAAAFSQLGIDAYDSAGSLRSMDDIFQELAASMDGMSDKEKQDVITAIFNKTDIASVNALLSTTAERWDEVYTAIGDAEGAAQQMADTQLDNLAGDVTLFKSALEGAQIVISDALTPDLRSFVQFGSDAISTLSAAFSEGGLSGAMDALGSILSDGLSMALQKLPEFVKAGTNLLTSLLRGITSNAPLIIDAAKEATSIIVTSIKEDGPEIFEAGIDILLTIAEGITETLPELVPIVFDAITTITSKLTDSDSAGRLIDSAAQVIGAIVTGLTNTIPALLPVAMDAITAFAKRLTSSDSIGSMIQSAMSILMSLVDGLTSSLPELIPVAVDAILTLVEKLTDPESIGQLVDAAITIIFALTDGLIAALPSLIEAAPTIVQNLVEALVENAPKLLESAATLIGKLVVGLFENLPQITASAWDIILTLKDGLASYWQSMVEAGGNIIKGLWTGIKDKGQWFLDQIEDWFGEVIQGIKNLLGIHSPSRVFAGIGRYMAAGLGEGWSDEFATVRDGIEDDLAFDGDDLSVSADVDRTGAGGGVTIVQNIYSQAQTAADLQQEARWEAERAVLAGV